MDDPVAIVGDGDSGTFAAPGNVRLRKARVDDAATIAEIHVRTGQHAYRDLLPGAYLERVSLTDRIERWQSRLGPVATRSAIWVAEEDGTILGFCHVGPSRDDDADHDTGHLHALYVSPGFARRGIGSALMSAGLASLSEAGFTAATLWVLTANARARAFYERHGWETDGASQTEEQEGVVFHETRYRLALR